MEKRLERIELEMGESLKLMQKLVKDMHKLTEAMEKLDYEVGGLKNRVVRLESATGGR